MKYTSEITIGLPLDRVVELFVSTENLYKWQEGLKSFEHLEGEAGEKEAVSTMVYAGRKGDLHMTETILENKLPASLHAEYRARGVYNRVANFFEEKGKGSTLWKAEHYFRFSGLMALMAPFMKKAFTGHTLLQMESFKTFAEQEAIK